MLETEVLGNDRAELFTDGCYYC